MSEIVLKKAYLNSSEAVGSEVPLTLRGNVLPAPFEQVNDGSAAAFGVWVELRKAQAEKGCQNKKLHLHSSG